MREDLRKCCRDACKSFAFHPALQSRQLPICHRLRAGQAGNPPQAGFFNLYFLNRGKHAGFFILPANGTKNRVLRRETGARLVDHAAFTLSRPANLV
jgi:hypothetical protein